MKKITKILAVIPAFFLILISLGGCGEHFDRSAYIQGMLDATYKGECDSYAKATNATLESLEQDYAQFVEHEAGIWKQFCGLSSELEIPDDLEASVSQLIEDIYRQASYEVAEANREGMVTITICPIDIYNDAYSDLITFTSEFRERNNNYEFTDYTDEDFTRAYLEPIIEIFRSHMDPLAFKDPVTVTVHVTPDESGRYSISENDVTSIYNALVNYTIGSPS